jgi:hypothetical protein
MRWLLVLIALLGFAISPTAEARHHHSHRYHHRHYAHYHHHRMQATQAPQLNFFGFPLQQVPHQGWSLGKVSPQAPARVATGAVSSRPADPRPGAWCGWWLRGQLGIADKRYNLARNWAYIGTNAGGPGIGVIVVWPHHVGQIVGQTARGWLLQSGNDGHAVRTREHSLNGVIAFRRL